MSMNGEASVGQIHDVKVTLYRNFFSLPEILWQENQCFKLTFDTPIVYERSEFDSETIPRRIEVSDILSFDSNGFLPASIPQGGVSIAPSIFKIAEYSIWVISLTQFPIPLETECYIKIKIPADLGFLNVAFTGGEMMLPNSGETVESVKQTVDATGTTVYFQGCYRDTTVGPSPPTNNSVVNKIKFKSNQFAI